MADKVIVLKDPFTGDRLFPVCSSKSIIDESGNPFDLSKYLTQETASTLYAAKTHTHEIANINGLQTELDNLKTSVSEGKSLIAAAVTDKGVQTAADATFQQMATNIGSIQTGVELWNVYLDLAPWEYTTPYLPGKNNYIYTTAGTYQVPAYSIIALSFRNEFHYRLTNAIELHRNGQSNVDHFAILLTGNNARIEMYR